MTAQRKAPLTYRALLLALSPVLLMYTVWRSMKDGGLLYLKQRFGYAIPETGSSIWMHAASVGEINTLLPLINEIRRRHPDTSLLITTNTPTGKKTLLEKTNNSLTHCYLPIDFYFSTRRFLAANQIMAGIITETEIWPTLYGQANFPVCIVNARLSPKSLKHVQGLFRESYRYAATQLSLVLARSRQDADAFKSLGVDSDKVVELGNLQYAQLSGQVSKSTETDTTMPDFCLLASTHDDEEYRVTKEWLAATPSCPLVIAPRHPERSRSIQSKLKPLGARLDVRSEGATLNDNTDIYLADTLGELDLWFNHAVGIFMGGSLIERGGHNMLEPARLGKSVVCGPHTGNFIDEVKLLRSADAITVVDDEKSVVTALVDASVHPERERVKGERAKQAVLSQQDIHKRYLDALEPVLRVNRSESNQP